MSLAEAQGRIRGLILILVAIVAGRGAEGAAPGEQPVIEAGREREVEALFAPARLGERLAGTGWVLHNIRIDGGEIRATLRADTETVELRLRPLQPDSDARARSRSFAFDTNPSEPSEGAAKAVQELFDAVRRNDRGGFYRVFVRPSPTQGGEPSPPPGAVVAQAGPDDRPPWAWLLLGWALTVAAAARSWIDDDASLRVPRSRLLLVAGLSAMGFVVRTHGFGSLQDQTLLAVVGGALPALAATGAWALGGVPAVVPAAALAAFAPVAIRSARTGTFESVETLVVLGSVAAAALLSTRRGPALPALGGACFAFAGTGIGGGAALSGPVAAVIVLAGLVDEPQGKRRGDRLRGDVPRLGAALLLGLLPLVAAPSAIASLAFRPPWTDPLVDGRFGPPWLLSLGILGMAWMWRKGRRASAGCLSVLTLLSSSIAGRAAEEFLSRSLPFVLVAAAMALFVLTGEHERGESWESSGLAIAVPAAGLWFSWPAAHGSFVLDRLPPPPEPIGSWHSFVLPILVLGSLVLLHRAWRAVLSARTLFALEAFALVFFAIKETAQSQGLLVHHAYFPARGFSLPGGLSPFVLLGHIFVVLAGRRLAERYAVRFGCPDRPYWLTLILTFYLTSGFASIIEATATVTGWWTWWPGIEGSGQFLGLPLRVFPVARVLANAWGFFILVFWIAYGGWGPRPFRAWLPCALLAAVLLPASRESLVMLSFPVLVLIAAVLSAYRGNPFRAALAAEPPRAVPVRLRLDATDAALACMYAVCAAEILATGRWEALIGFVPCLLFHAGSLELLPPTVELAAGIGLLIGGGVLGHGDVALVGYLSIRPAVLFLVLSWARRRALLPVPLLAR